jgi:hypothetical protein
MKLCYLFVVAFLPSVAIADEGHEDGQRSCACMAEEHGFSIDCDDQETMEQSMASLLANGCENDCSSDLCIRNYYIIQSHQ